MQVQEIHDQAFEIFYTTRSVLETSKQIGKSRQSVNRWKIALKWDDRVIIREKEINKGIDEKFIAGIVDKKAEMLKSLSGMDTIIDQEIRTAFELDKKTGKYVPRFHIEKYKDLLDTIALKLKINDNRIKVIGEDLQRPKDVEDMEYILAWKNNEELDNPVLPAPEAEVIS